MASALAALVLASVASAQTPSADDLLLVDCRLPAKQKRIGGRTYPMAARPIRTTAVDCRIRGGEYTVYDRANYQTSLKIWLAEAEKGNLDAQYYVGKIYEGGLGTTPDYAAAAQWYEKAANAGHSASQFSLGALYEKGLGVPADSTKAFNLYRKSTGMQGNYVLVESDRYAALQQAAQDLALREEELNDLQRQLDDAKKAQTRDKEREQALVRQLEEQKRKADAQKKDVARLQGLVKNAVTVQSQQPAPPRAKLGRYFALVIGNSRYEHFPAAASSENDARTMAALLRDQYGFKVTLLVNAPSAKILSALYELSQDLAENDNLVVYYAGRGKRDLRNRRGWWLPVDAANNDSRTNWIPNQEVSDRLALIPARHILVLADASYVGDITRGAPQPETEKMTAAQWAKYVETTQRRKARLALSSGADEPVPAGQSSRFTSTLVSVLQREKGVVPASRIHREVVDALTSGNDAGSAVPSAIPTFAPLQSAFHEGADFLFQRQ